MPQRRDRNRSLQRRARELAATAGISYQQALDRLRPSVPRSAEPLRPMTPAEFTEVLRRACATGPLSVVTAEADADADAADEARGVWFAAEVALGILHPGYVPNRPARAELRALMTFLDEASD